MDTHTSSSESQPSRAFYLPAMTVLSAVPGRVERFVTAALRDRSELTRTTVVGERVREFYLPATFRR
jgi:hypothetical protein